MERKHKAVDSLIYRADAILQEAQQSTACAVQVTANPSTPTLQPRISLALADLKGELCML